MKIKLFSWTLIIGLLTWASCDPKEDPVTCQADSVKILDGIISNGHITLCNAQGPNIVYEPGICKINVKSDSLIFIIFSINPNFHYFYSDTLTYDCVVYEEMARAYQLHPFASSEDMGQIEETNFNMFIVMTDPECPNSSFFEGGY